MKLCGANRFAFEHSPFALLICLRMVRCAFCFVCFYKCANCYFCFVWFSCLLFLHLLLLHVCDLLCVLCFFMCLRTCLNSWLLRLLSACGLCFRACAWWLEINSFFVLCAHTHSHCMRALRPKCPTWSGRIENLHSCNSNKRTAFTTPFAHENSLGI